MMRLIWEFLSQSNRASRKELGKFFPSCALALARRAALYGADQGCAACFRQASYSRKPTMTLRARFLDEMKASMKAGTAERTSAIRMIMAKLKDADIASRPSGVPEVPEEQIVSMLRGMVKSRRESVEMYTQGNRPELAAKEEAEIAVIEAFLPQQLDDTATEAAVAEAVAETGATSIKDMGKVMAALRAKHAATLDMGKAGPMVKAKLGA
jgi:uncharacterized protein YqeY